MRGGSKPINFGGMTTMHLPVILGTRYQGFDPFPYFPITKWPNFHILSETPSFTSPASAAQASRLGIQDGVDAGQSVPHVHVLWRKTLHDLHMKMNKRNLFGWFRV